MDPSPEGQSFNPQKLLEQPRFSGTLNQEYRVLQEELDQHESHGTLNGWLTNTLKQQFNRDYPANVLSTIHLSYNSPEIRALRMRYGYNFYRPTLTMNMAETRNLLHSLSGRHGDGFVLPLVTTENGQPTTMRLIVSTNNGVQLLHELKHSIDPLDHKRPGKNRVLEEFAAFHENILHPPVDTITTTTNYDGVEKTKTEVKRRNTTYKYIGIEVREAYFEQYKEYFADEAEYRAFVDKTSAIVEALSKVYTPREMDRILLNAQTVEQLQLLLESGKPKNK